MITLNFFKDGIYIYGHTKIETCTLISYAINCLIEDCLSIDNDVEYYESGYDGNNKNLGYSYLKINEECGKHINELNIFHKRMKFWLQDKDCIINIVDSYIDFKEGLDRAREYLKIILDKS